MHLYGASTNQIYEEVVSRWDQAQFIRTFRDFWDPFPHVDAVKYLNVDYWLRRAIVHYTDDKLFSGTGRLQVLEIGCGMGYFLEVCRHFGHEVTGLDLDGESIYNLSIEFLGIPRTVYRIDPDGRLPNFPNQFDVVTAYMACFNLLPGGTSWGPESWTRFLPQLYSILRANGVALIQFNLDQSTGLLFPPQLPKIIEEHGGFQSKFYREYLRLDRVD